MQATPASLVSRTGHPSRSGIVIAPMDAAWLADAKWIRLRGLLPEPLSFWAAAGIFWATVAESWRQGVPDPSACDYIDGESPEQDRLCNALYRAGLTDVEGRLTGETWDKWTRSMLERREAAAERQRRSRARSGGNATSRDVTVTGRASRARHPTPPIDVVNADADATSRPRVDLDAYAPVALAVESLTGVPYAVADPDSKMGQRVVDLIARHGTEATTEALGAVATDVRAQTSRAPTVRQLIFATGDFLDPVVSVRQSERDCATCLNTGVTATGTRCPDCHRGRKDR